MRAPTLVLLSALLMTGHQRSDFVPVGSFTSVRVSRSEDPHCYGWSLKLWRHEGRVVGLVNRHEGLCGDPPCRVLANVTHEARSGRLTFFAFDLKFEGTLRPHQVTGTLGEERLTLTRDENPMDARYDKNLDAWCEFWGAVPRCQGVAELCRSLRR